MREPQAHRAQLWEVSRRLGVGHDEYEQVCKLAYYMTEQQYKWGWFNAAIRARTLEKGQVFADLASDMLMHVSEGNTPREALNLALHGWSAEIWAQGCVKQAREDGHNVYHVIGLTPDPTVGQGVSLSRPDDGTHDYERVEERLDAERLVREIQAYLAPEEWDLLVKLSEAGSIRKLGPALGVSTGTAQNRVSEIRAKLREGGFERS